MLRVVGFNSNSVFTSCQLSSDCESIIKGIRNEVNGPYLYQIRENLRKNEQILMFRIAFSVYFLSSNCESIIKGLETVL